MKLPAKLDSGSHDTPEHGLCVMEAAAMFAGEKHSARPKCVAPTLREFLIPLNDWMTDDERQVLMAYVPKLVGTAHDECLAESEQRRGFLCADYAVRVFAPITLRSAGLEREAVRLEALPEIVDAVRAASYAGAASYVSAAWAASSAASAAAGAASAASYAARAARAASAASAAAGAVSAAWAASSAASAAAGRAQVIRRCMELLGKMI